ncbi:MAG: site-specific integrase [Deltaproteobacteria bacterium]|nr:site-specific integrase [Deltaproteobacteria bacterium]
MKRWRWIKENPVSFIDMPKVNNGRCRYLSNQEYASLFKALDDAPEPWLKSVIIIALNTGLRLRNIIYMRWSWVNMEDRLITISGEYMKNSQNLGLPLTQEAYDTLEELGNVRRVDTDLVFHEDGEAVYPVKLQRAFKGVCTAAKLTDFRFHDLRHTYASYLRQRGIDLHTISVLLSHRDMRMSARYAHLSVESLRDAVAVLDRKRLQFGDIGKEKGVTNSVTP